jgi:hypothetical protein
MTKVIMRANAEYDLVGTNEFDQFRQDLMQRFDVQNQSRFRGEKIMRFPSQYVVASAVGSLIVDQPGVQGGPEQGFIWRVCSLVVISSGADNGTAINPGPQVIYYTTSDGTIQQRNTKDTTQSLGQAFNPGSRGWYLMPGEQAIAQVIGVTAGNTYMMCGQIAEVPAEMQGKLI